MIIRAKGLQSGIMNMGAHSIACYWDVSQILSPTNEASRLNISNAFKMAKG